MLINIEKVIVIFKIQLKLSNFCNKKYKSNYYKKICYNILDLRLCHLMPSKCSDFCFK